MSIDRSRNSVEYERGAGGVALLRDAAVTAVVLLLVFAAFDDITTDNATAFPLEYTFLAISAAWFLVVAWRLLRAERRVLAGMSVFAVVTAFWAQRHVGQAVMPFVWSAYLVIVAAYLWFWWIAVAMAWLGYRARRLAG